VLPEFVLAGRLDSADTVGAALAAAAGAPAASSLAHLFDAVPAAHGPLVERTIRRPGIAAGLSFQLNLRLARQGSLRA
jgi:hypothetical protein